jgi:hypothetical protein
MSQARRFERRKVGDEVSLGQNVWVKLSVGLKGELNKHKGSIIIGP